MELRQVLADDRAVSPVIGVILMVAVTVILAAVIGTFVLGIGSQVTSETPTANFEFEYDDGGDGDFSDDDDEVRVTHRGGDDVEKEALTLRIAGKPVSVMWDNPGDAIVGAGDTATYTESSGDVQQGSEVKLIWDDPDGEGSAILAEDEVN